LTVETDSMANCRPRLPRGVRLRHDRVRDRWVLLAPERIFELDEIGLEILKRCDGSVTAEEMSAALAAAFGASPEEVRPDVEAFLKDFADKRVVDL
jgi:pyrroloquinoline quinone biosynthesis protein D